MKINKANIKKSLYITAIIILSILLLLNLPKLIFLVVLTFNLLLGKAEVSSYQVGRVIGNLVGTSVIFGAFIYGIIKFVGLYKRLKVKVKKIDKN